MLHLPLPAFLSLYTAVASQTTIPVAIISSPGLVCRTMSSLFLLKSLARRWQPRQMELCKKQNLLFIGPKILNTWER